MAKTTTFAVTHFSVAFGVTYALTGDLVLGGTIALIEPAVNTVAYFFHEKVWERSKSAHVTSTAKSFGCEDIQLRQYQSA